MSKAEERALEYCCSKCSNNKHNCGMKLLSNGRNCIKCSNYIQGYHQAEKDNELTWEDMFTIYHLVNEVLDDYAEGKTKKEVGEEILKRFKDYKERKEK